MSINVTLVMSEENHELHAKLAALVAEHAGEIKLVSIEKCPDVSYDGILIISDTGEVHGAAMSARIISAASASSHLDLDASRRNVGIVGLSFDRDRKFVLGMLAASIIVKKQMAHVEHTEPRKFTSIREFPIPVQCKKRYLRAVRKK